MKIKIVILLVFFVILNSGCDRGANGSRENASVPEKTSHDFKMTIEKVDELKGVILKGISIIGTVESGCIVNMDKYVIKRDGQTLLETDARILEVTEKPGAEAAVKGDYVHLYIPDRKEGEVKPGDTVVGNVTSCK